MEKAVVSVVKYEAPIASVRKAVDLCNGLSAEIVGAKVFIKPNVVFWTKAVEFPKFGVITTSRVVQDMVVLLKEMGAASITIGEGIVTSRPKDKETPAHAFNTLGYGELKKRYGVEVLDILQRPFVEVDLGDGVVLNFNKDALESDFIVNLPVLKTHAQAVVSLGIKNLKGLIDIDSRKKCHNSDPEKDLNFMISKLANKMPPMFTLIDGIYTLERGPGFDGKAKRSNILVASRDVLACDMVGAHLLGHAPNTVPHLVHCARDWGRSLELEDIEILGEDINALASYHEYTFPYTSDQKLPLPMARLGVKGLSYPKYDLTICTYCSSLNGAVLYSIARAWKGKEWDNIEILTGKAMRPSPGMKKTILLGKCMYQLNKDHPNINELIAVKGCPPDPKKVVEALQSSGIELDPSIILNLEAYPGIFMAKYKDKKEFDEAFFRVSP